MKMRDDKMEEKEELTTFIETVNKKIEGNKNNLLKTSVFYIVVYFVLIIISIFKLLPSQFLYNLFLIGILLISIFIALFSYRYKNFDNLFLNLFVILSFVFFFISSNYLIFILSIFCLIVYLSILIAKKNVYKNFWISVSSVFLFFIFILSQLNLIISPISYSFAKEIAEHTQKESKEVLSTNSDTMFFLIKNTKSALYEAFLPLINPEEYKQRLEQTIGNEVKDRDNLGVLIKSYDFSEDINKITTIPLYLFLTLEFHFDKDLRETIKRFGYSTINISLNCSVEDGNCNITGEETIYTINLSNHIYKKPSYIIEINPHDNTKFNLTINYTFLQYGEGVIYLNNLSVFFVQLRSLLNLGVKLNNVNNKLIGYMSLNDFAKYRINDGSENKITKINNLIFCFSKILSENKNTIKEINSFEYGSWKEENILQNFQCFKLEKELSLEKREFINLPLKIKLGEEILERKELILTFFILVNFEVKKTFEKHISLENNLKEELNFKRNMELIKKYCKDGCKDGEELYNKLKKVWHIKNKTAFILLNELITNNLGRLKPLFGNFLREYTEDEKLEDVIRFYILTHVYIESNFDPKAENINNDGSKDLGLFQINMKYHRKECDERCAFDIEKSFNYYIELNEEIIEKLREENCLNMQNVLRSYNGGICCWDRKGCDKSERVYEHTKNYYEKFANNFEKISDTLIT